MDPSILVPGKYWTLTANGSTPALGFQDVAVGLARLSTFTTLSAVDKAMANQRDQPLKGDDFKCLVAARNVAKHKVLSLPLWEELSETEKCGGNETLYECCRLAAILYANAVVFPTLEDFPGIRKPVRLLKELLDQESDEPQVTGVEYNAMLWAVCVGGIGAYQTEHWHFFVSTLRSYVGGLAITSFEGLKSVLRDFVWSDRACDGGLAVIWAAAQSLTRD